MPALTEGHRLGPYRIVRLLGEGGMGAVYEARQEPLDRRVALKTLHPEYARNQDAIGRFFNEAKVLSRLEHPSIVQASDFGTGPDGMAYLVMEYLRGESLGRRLQTLSERGESLPVMIALQFSWQVADVLAIAHAQGIVHRDVKPDNLMLVADPVAPGGERVKVLDFGIAKLTHSDDKGAIRTDSQTVMGTPMYMSPEQCAGAGGVDAKTDVYSLGCVLYQVLAGRPPFIAEGAGQLIGMHLFQAPPPLRSLSPKVPSAIADLVHRLLIKDKTRRPTMSEAADALGSLLPNSPGGSQVARSRLPPSTDPDATVAGPLPPRSTTLGQSIGQATQKRRRRVWLLASALAGVCMISVIGIHSRPVAHTPSAGAVTRPASSSAHVEPVPPPQADLALPAKRILHWQIETVPTNATVLDSSNQRLGVTPWTRDQEPGAGEESFLLRLEGYSEATAKLARSTDSTQKVVMVRTPKPTAKKEQLKPPIIPNAVRVQPTKKSGIGYEE